jgi:hypothetical protein
MFDQAGMSLGKVTMDGSEQIGPFDLAVIAFNVRFRQDLTSCWENLRSATIQPLIDGAPECKQGVLRKCFSDAAEQIAAVVHSHFPRLLAVATKQRPSGHGQQKSPMGWTAAHIGGQAYNFLGMEAENFKDTATPRADSRVLEATCQILYCARCLPKDSTDEFLLPWWADHNYLVGYWLGRNSVVEDGLDSLVGDYPFLPPSGDESEGISHADSLAWIRECEVEIRNALESQIEKEMFDAVIAAGGAGDAVAKEPDRKSKAKPGPKPTTRIQTIKEILRKHPTWPAKRVCELMDNTYSSRSDLPALANPIFGGRRFPSWQAAYDSKKAKASIDQLVARNRPK